MEENRTGAERVRLVDIRSAPLDVAEVLAAVEDPGAGGVTLFVGTVRDHDDAKSVEGLDYSAHPTALDRLRAVVEAVADRHPVTAVAAVHRVGKLAIGDAAVVVAAAAPHRGEAFDAARDLIDPSRCSGAGSSVGGFACASTVEP